MVGRVGKFKVGLGVKKAPVNPFLAFKFSPKELKELADIFK